MPLADTKLCQFYPAGPFYQHINHCCYLLIIVSGVKAILIRQLPEPCPQPFIWEPWARRAASGFRKSFLNTFHISGHFFFYLKMFKEGASRLHRNAIMSVSHLLSCRDSSNTEMALPCQPQMVHLIRRGLWGAWTQRRSIIWKFLGQP